ncbi:MAG: urea ABC transporter permease subunit UrtB, partial [Pseudomonadota bacterium]|nr:urea ABC transporter permease subunit UrtB [Pseudomonadota bacterium]
MRHCIPHRFFPLACLLTCLLALLLAGPAQAASLEQIVTGLDDRSYDRKEQVIGEIAASGDERSIDLLKRLLAGDLYFREADGRLVIRGARGEQGYAVTDALTGDALEPAGRRDLDKVSVNNRLRSVIRGALAGLNLNDPQVAVRYEAVQEMMRSLDEESVALLRQYRAQEQSRKVQEAMDQALAMANLADTDIEVQLAAVQTLTGSLNPEVRARLTQLRDTEADDPQARRIAAAAQEALAAIESRLQFYRLVETVFFGLSLGSVLLLAAIGLAITFGVMGVINMAHGELLMIGAYTTYVVQLLMPEAIGLSILVAVPAAFLVAGLFGVAIERGVIRFLYGRPLETLLAT